MSMFSRLAVPALVAAALMGTACAPKATSMLTVTPAPGSTASGLLTALSATVLAPATLGNGGAIVSTYGGGIVSTYGGGIISTYGGGFASPVSLGFRVLASVDKFVPVKNATVVVQGLDGQKQWLATTDDQGKCHYDKLPRNEVITLRTTIETGGKTFYLSNLSSTEDATAEAIVDPIGTVIEAKFFKLLAGKSLKTRTVTLALLKRLWGDVNSLSLEIPSAMLDGSKTQADLVAFYDELAKQNPSLQPAIDELFKALNEGS